MLDSVSTNPSPDSTIIPDVKAVDELTAMCARLPAPWTVLVRGRTGSAEAPPWAKYIAFHPEKGIALVDLAPAQPDAAVARFEEFLARADFGTLSRRRPPVVSVALAPDRIPTLANRLSKAFSAAPHFQPKDTRWVETVIHRLTATEGISLTRLRRQTVPIVDEVARHIWPRRESLQPEPMPAVEPAFEEAIFEPVAAPAFAWDEARPLLRDRSARQRRQLIGWAAAASVSLIAALVVLYVKAPAPPLTAKAEAVATPAPSAKLAAPASAETAPAPASGAIESLDANATREFAPTANVVAPPPGVPPIEESGKTIAPPTQGALVTGAISPLNPAALTPPATAAQENAVAAMPDRLAALPVPQKSQNRETTEADRAAQTARERKRARASKVELAARPAEEETVTIDGLSYVKGREPHPLGTVTGQPDEPGPASGPLSAPAN